MITQIEYEQAIIFLANTLESGIETHNLGIIVRYVETICKERDATAQQLEKEKIEHQKCWDMCRGFYESVRRKEELIEALTEKLKPYQKRYAVMHFPSLYGEPYETNWWCLARSEAVRRRWRFRSEVRIVDNKTGKHLIW